MRVWSRLCVASVMLSACGPRAPVTVDTALRSHELLRVPSRVPAYCSVTEDAVQRRVAIPDTPRWFFKPFAELPLVAYASESGNRLINLDTGYVIPLPGTRDAVPTPDERFLTFPGVYLTRVADLLDGRRRTRPLRLHADLDGEYQSPGLLRVFDGGRDYRLLIGRFAPTVRDFRVRDGVDGQPRIEPLNEAWRPCPQRRLKLPMLSKDGREFAAYDVAAGSTRVFAIDGAGDCRPVADLGIPTGKVSFSFDGRLLAFHLAVFDEASVSIIENPDDRWTSNVFVYDRRSRSIGRITHHTAGNAYYPAFRRDGTVVYLFKPLAERYARYSFAVADPARIGRWLPLRWYTQDCAAGDDRCHRSLAVGALWGYACARYDTPVTPRLAALNTLSLDPAVCRQLISDKWTEFRALVAGSALHRLPEADGLRELPASDLLGQCL